jgi:phosphatidylserine decarboxylase
MIPQVEREVFVNAAEANHKMIFKGADGSFVGIAAMDAGRAELEVDFFKAEEMFQGFGGALVVETLKAGAQAGGVEFGMEGLLILPGKDGGARVIFNGFGKDAVAVVVIQDEQVSVAGAGWGNKAAGLVTEDFFGWFY